MTRTLLSALALLALACSSTGPDVSGRYAFQEESHAEGVRLVIQNRDGRLEADSLFQSGEARWVSGILRRGDGGFNAPWDWHLDPATISFDQVTIEACQTWPSAVEPDLEYWIGFGRVCFWGTIEARGP